MSSNSTPENRAGREVEAMTGLSKLGQAALAYARKGKAVFPLHGIRDGRCTCGNINCGRNAGKHPRTEHGFKDASTDERVIQRRWEEWPDANIGHPTGDLVVLDVDGPEGEAALAALEEEHGKLPETLTARTGRPQGRHLYFSANGAEIHGSTGKLGPGLDIRAQGNYVILPPSVHASGHKYQWSNKHEPAPFPTWVANLPATPQRTKESGIGVGEKITEGKRHPHLLKLAGELRAKGYGEATITAALLAENASRCDPLKPEGDVRALAHDICQRYSAGTLTARPEPPNPWLAAESLDEFLMRGADGAAFLDLEKRILAREAITEIFSPRGLGKSLYALWLALHLARRGFRVMYVDRDNPRHVIKARLIGFGATPGEIATLTKTGVMKIIPREKCPPLTNAAAWALFPYKDYDVVFLDSFDSAAEGVGEQDSSKPSKAIAPLLDIARRENGPAVLVLGNTVKSGKHSRGCGVLEDRADVSYEVRDATGLQPSGSKPWFEELPPADAGSWASRASRRKQREKFRLAFVASKFRIGVEPEPFILEIDLTSETWSVADVTGQVDREGTEARAQRAREHAEKISKARDALVTEILRRDSAGEPAMLKDRDAIPFLTNEPHSLKRTDARDIVNDPQRRWNLAPIEGQKGHPIGLLPAGKNGDSGGNATIMKDAKIQGENKADFRRPHEKATAEIDPSRTRENGESQDSPISAESPIFPPDEDVELL